MKLTTTKKMVQCLNKANDPAKTNIDHFTRLDMDLDTFQQCVSYDPFLHEVDYDCNDRIFHVIRVTYTDDCCACNQYITTRDLVTCYKQRVFALYPGNFFEYICDCYAI